MKEIFKAQLFQERRRQWMSVLARAPADELERAWRRVVPAPEFQWLRRPETGLVMVRARAGGAGAKFNLGEASVTRCALRIAGGQTGFAWVLGRDARKAELAALFDALLQRSEGGDALEREVVAPLALAQKHRKETASRKAAATRVNFYTLVRGEDEQPERGAA